MILEQVDIVKSVLSLMLEVLEKLLLTMIAGILKEDKNWLVINLNSDLSAYNNAYDKIYSQLSDKDILY